MLNEISSLPSPIFVKKLNEPQLSHSTISEKLSSEEKEEINDDLIDEFQKEEILNNFIALKKKETFGEIDLEFCFRNKNNTFNLIEPVLKKTSFFYVKDQEEKNQYSSASRKGSVFNKRASIGGRRVSQAMNNNNSKNDRIESLAKFQSDIIHKIFKSSERSYNFVIDGQKYQVKYTNILFYMCLFINKYIILLHSSIC